MRVKSLILTIIDLLFPSSLFKVKKNKVVVTSFRGREFSGNPALVVEELLRLRGDLDIVWLTNNMDEDAPDGVRLVGYNTLRSYLELSTSAIWIDDFRKKYFPKKKKSQTYFQLWHGLIPLKKIEFDAVDKLDSDYVREARRDGQNSDIMVSGNSFTTNLYKKSFWFNGVVMETGTPSADYFFEKHSAENLSRIRDRVGVSSHQKVVLYSPTFRDVFVRNDFDLESDKLRAVLHMKFGGDWKLLIRLHPNARNFEKEIIKDNYPATGVTDYPSLDELISISDVVITDYSSVMFNAMYGGKKVFLFAKDYTQYMQKERGFYSIVEILPFSMAKSVDQLLANISAFNDTQYLSKKKKFLRSIGDHENGHAAETIAEKVSDLLT